jgi:tetratricopeptide (TPR) repeat protein/predicted Ser/Thr protein kinase
MTSEPEGNELDRTRAFKVIASGMTISHYRIERKIGAGGMGEVFLAQDTKLKRHVALKFLPPEFTLDAEVKTRFMREAQAAAALSHPNIITVYEVSEYQNRSYIAMEYVEGASLKDMIDGKELRINQVIDIAMQISHGLAKAHEAGIVHRDIKPQNVLIDRDGRARILDFGLAKLKGDAKLTQAGSTLGTISYMSPEQAQGEEVDRRSDIFSLGVMLYEMITGRVPFQGEQQAAILNSIVTEQPQPLARYNNKVSPELERIVAKALAKDREDRYQHADDLLADLRCDQKMTESTRTAQFSAQVPAVKRKRNLFPYVASLTAVFLVVVVLLIVKAARFDAGLETGIMAQENTLAIMHFENVKDSQDTDKVGEMISELLITGLSESEYMRVVSSQRLFDILKMMGREGIKVVDKTVASDVARKAQAKYMLLGKVFSTEPDLIITCQLVDVQTGNVVSSERIAGPNGANIFSLVDSLSYEIRRDLPVPALARKGVEKPVADITTHSPEALRLYLEGVELHRKLYMKEAAEKLEQATRIDTTFASAYRWLAVCYSSLHDAAKARETIKKAANFSDRVSKKEKLLIDAFDQLFHAKVREAEQTLKEMVKLYPEEKIAYRTLGLVSRVLNLHEEAIVWYNQVIQLDSLDKEAYNSLAYVYDRAGRYEEAVQSINKYIQLAPGEANPYDTRGDIYARHAEVDKAIESYKKALEIKPDFESSIEKLGLMHLYKREYDTAEKYFVQYGEAGGKATKSMSRFDLAFIPMTKGKYELALTMLRQGIAADQLDKLAFPQLEKHQHAALLHIERKDYESALRSAEQMVQLMASAFPEAVYAAKSNQGYVLVQAGRMEEAEKILREVSELAKDKTEGEKYMLRLLEVLIEFNKGETDQALKDAQALAERQKNDYPINFWLAHIYLETGMIGEAVEKLQELSNWSILGTVRNSTLSLKAAYLLGVAYEKSGWDNRAIEKYKEILDIWKDADPWIPELKDARERLDQLKEAIETS